MSANESLSFVVEDAQEAQYAEHVAANHYVATWYNDEDRTIYSPGPRLATRKRQIRIEASALRIGRCIRVRYFAWHNDESGAYLHGFAEVVDIKPDPGCPWNGVYPPTIHLRLRMPDDSYGHGTARPGELLEVAALMPATELPSQEAFESPS